MAEDRNDLVVHIVDDDEAVRDSLESLFRSEGVNVRAYASANQFLENFNGVQASCVIADIRMPGMDGLKLQSILSEIAPSVPVVLITGHGDVSMAVKALKAGAADFIEKPFRAGDLVERVNAAVAAVSAQAGAASSNAHQVAQRLARLTKREREVFELLSLGDANKAIARKLGISPRTVEIHRARVMEKMNARNLPHLVRMAVEVEGTPD